MAKKIEAMRVVIARAIFEEPGANGKRFGDLSEERQQGWLADADRVIGALRDQMAAAFMEYEYGDGGAGADWLANSPADLWHDFFDDCLRKHGPDPACNRGDADMCIACDCWKMTRKMCL